MATAFAVGLAAFVIAQVGRFPEPVLTGNDHWADQYESFRAHVTRDGPHELLILGNSVARQGVRVRLMSSALGDRFGVVVQAYNFGAGGTDGSTLPLLTRLAYGVDRPGWCVFVVAPPMVAGRTDLKETNRRFLLSSPYGRALTDPLGWRAAIRRSLLDHVTLCRLRYAIKAFLRGEPQELHHASGHRVGAGYLGIPEAPPGPLPWERLLPAYREWVIDAASAAGLVDAVRLAQTHGTRVWIAEAPTHPGLGDFVPELDRRLAEFRELLGDAGRSTGGEVLLLGEDLELTAEDFRDTQHLRPDAADRYTTWLSERMVTSLESAP